MENFMNTNYQYSCTAPFFIKNDKSGSIQVTGIFCGGKVLFSAAKYLAIKTIENGHRKSWEAQFTQAIRLLVEYTEANDGEFENAHDMFKMFAYRLQFGTINEKGCDPSGLFWEQRSQKSAQTLLNYITEYSDWLYNESDGKTKLLNPHRSASPQEKMLNLSAYNHRINNSFLKHTYSDEHKAKSVESVRSIKAAKTSRQNKQQEAAKTFPEEKFADLITFGFRKKSAKSGGRTAENYRVDYILITMLMNLGGLRVSESFHLYVDDIIPFEDRLEIKVYHPVEGLAPARARRKYKNNKLQRKEFLMKEYGLLDRKSERTGRYAGWKNSAVDPSTKAFPVLTFADKALVVLFYELFQIYMKMRVEPLPGREHPFLFTDRNGDPLQLKTYTQAYERAIRKIGMTPLLEYGGSPHCHRHSYGQRLADCKVDPLTIKYCMHHSSLESQETYTKPNMNKIRSSLTVGLDSLGTNHMCELKPADLDMGDV
jgi:integrase